MSELVSDPVFCHPCRWALSGSASTCPTSSGSTTTRSPPSATTVGPCSGASYGRVCSAKVRHPGPCPRSAPRPLHTPMSLLSPLFRKFLVLRASQVSSTFGQRMEYKPLLWSHYLLPDLFSNLCREQPRKLHRRNAGGKVSLFRL